MSSPEALKLTLKWYRKKHHLQVAYVTCGFYSQMAPKVELFTLEVVSSERMKAVAARVVGLPLYSHTAHHSHSKEGGHHLA